MKSLGFLFLLLPAAGICAVKFPNPMPLPHYHSQPPVDEHTHEHSAKRVGIPPMPKLYRHGHTNNGKIHRHASKEHTVHKHPGNNNNIHQHDEGNSTIHSHD